jgi:hypothetical protein
MKKKKCKRGLHKKQRVASQGQLEEEDEEEEEEEEEEEKEEEEHEVEEKEDTVLPLKSSKHSSTKVLTFIF